MYVAVTVGGQFADDSLSSEIVLGSCQMIHKFPWDALLQAVAVVGVDGALHHISMSPAGNSRRTARRVALSSMVAKVDMSHCGVDE